MHGSSMIINHIITAAPPPSPPTPQYEKEQKENKKRHTQLFNDTWRHQPVVSIIFNPTKHRDLTTLSREKMYRYGTPVPPRSTNNELRKHDFNTDVPEILRTQRKSMRNKPLFLEKPIECNSNSRHPGNNANSRQREPVGNKRCTTHHRQSSTTTAVDEPSLQNTFAGILLCGVPGRHIPRNANRRQAQATRPCEKKKKLLTNCGRQMI